MQQAIESCIICHDDAETRETQYDAYEKMDEIRLGGIDINAGVCIVLGISPSCHAERH